MSALPQPRISVEPLTRIERRQARRRRHQEYLARQSNTAIPFQSQSGVHHSKQPQVKVLPVRVQVLSMLQKASLGITLTSLAASVGLYIAGVGIPQSWSQQYKNLETLQRQERQLIEINETLKYQMAQQAMAKNSELATIQPDELVFIPAAPVPANEAAQEQTSEDNQLLFQHVSWGY